MAGLADILNAPTEREFEGKAYKLRQPTLLEMGMFERWMETLAYDAIERRTYQDEAQRDTDRKNLTNEIAAGVYEWNGELCVRRLQTLRGMAKILEITLADQGMTPDRAERWVEHNAKEIAATMASKVLTDPKEVAAVLASVGLPPDFLSHLQTPRSTTESTTSADCAPTS